MLHGKDGASHVKLKIVWVVVLIIYVRRVIMGIVWYLTVLKINVLSV